MPRYTTAGGGHAHGALDEALHRALHGGGRGEPHGLREDGRDPRLLTALNMRPVVRKSGVGIPAPVVRGDDEREGLGLRAAQQVPQRERDGIAPGDGFRIILETSLVGALVWIAEIQHERVHGVRAQLAARQVALQGGQHLSIGLRGVSGVRIADIPEVGEHAPGRVRPHAIRIGEERGVRVRGRAVVQLRVRRLRREELQVSWSRDVGGVLEREVHEPSRARLAH